MKENPNFVKELLVKRFYRVNHLDLDALLHAAREQGAAYAQDFDSEASWESYEKECQAFSACMKERIP